MTLIGIESRKEPAVNYSFRQSSSTRKQLKIHLGDPDTEITNMVVKD